MSMEEKSTWTVSVKTLDNLEGPLVNPPPDVTREWTIDDGAYWSTEWTRFMTETKTMIDHPSHKTRFSDSSLYDEVCIFCGATDGAGDRRLKSPCPVDETTRAVALWKETIFNPPSPSPSLKEAVGGFSNSYLMVGNCTVNCVPISVSNSLPYAVPYKVTP